MKYMKFPPPLSWTNTFKKVDTSDFYQSGDFIYSVTMIDDQSLNGDLMHIEMADLQRYSSPMLVVYTQGLVRGRLKTDSASIAYGQLRRFVNRATKSGWRVVDMSKTIYENKGNIEQGTEIA